MFICEKKHIDEIIEKLRTGITNYAKSKKNWFSFMKIGVPKEIKPQENRIGLTPDSVKTLVSEGHEVLVENNGGFEAGFENDQYIKAGAKIADAASDIFNDAEIIVKVKEPQKVEVDMIREIKSYIPIYI